MDKSEWLMQDFAFDLTDQSLEEWPIFMASTAGYIPENWNDAKLVETGYNKGSYFADAPIKLVGRYDPKFVLRGDSRWVRFYERYANRFFEEVIGSISHETLHVVVSWRLCDNLAEHFTLYVKASQCLDNNFIHGEDDNRLDRCGLNLNALLNWLH